MDDHVRWTLATVSRPLAADSHQVTIKEDNMIGKRPILAALCLSALSICAFAAFGVSNAAAMTLHECKAETGTGTKYTDSTCST
ncbi:MAG TPA: hypothetical protein VHZ54_12660, partial [Solirubrobacterales bacterium]|nr:hypothetical protein [Solirubrobacterales bacterium]